MHSHLNQTSVLCLCPLAKVLCPLPNNPGLQKSACQAYEETWLQMANYLPWHATLLDCFESAFPIKSPSGALLIQQTSD